MNPKTSPAERPIKPLKWVPHHVRNNGWFGTSNGQHIVYVYRPATWAQRRDWHVFAYFGPMFDGDLRRPAKRGKGIIRIRFSNPGKAKRAAQRYWRQFVTDLIK